MTRSTASAEAVLLSREGHVARILLDRPEQHNALDAEGLAHFRSHLDAVDDDRQIRALIVTGAGEKTFCSGASLAQIESGEMSGALFETLTDRLASVRVPTVCALNGSVYGGGTELALCCDFRIGVVGSRMFVPAARLGLCYPLGGLRRYVERLLPGTAQRLLLANEQLDADEMLRVGFLTHLVERPDLEPATRDLAERLASFAPLAVQAMKRILGQVERGSVDEQEARELIRACMASGDLQEGLRAHREGDTPRFRGR